MDIQKAARDTHIATVMKALDDATNEAVELVAQVENRLVTLMRSDLAVAPPGGTNATPRVNYVPLADSIDTHVARVQGINRRLHDVLTRLEI